MAAGCDAMMGTSIRSSPITSRLMAAAPDCRIIAKFTIGTDDVDVDAATERGILVTHAPTEANWGGVAEGTVTNLLALVKKTRERDRWLKTTSNWRNLDHQGTFVGRRASDGYPGIVIGIIGLGQRQVQDRVRILDQDLQLRRPRGPRSHVLKNSPADGSSRRS